MEKKFNEFLENLKLTDNQIADAKTKYDNVCSTLHSKYYDTEYNGKTKFLFGSYKTKTNIRPITPDQDVDVLFKIPADKFDKFKDHKNNGPSALLDEVRKILKEKFVSTDKIRAWGKVVLIQFADGTHNIELLPAKELANGKFEIPNTENGGNWEIFDPQAQIDKVQNSNSKTDGLTLKLIRMIKKWNRNVKTLSLSSFNIENHVISFFGQFDSSNKGTTEVVYEFFSYLLNTIDSENYSFCETAKNRAKKAIEYENSGEIKSACEEWRKIFGNEFPASDKSSEDKGSAVKPQVISSTPMPYLN